MIGSIKQRARCVATAAGAVMVAALVAVAVVVVPASPASATTSAIVITTPAPGASFTSGFTSASVPINGNANIGQQALETNVISDVQVSVTFGGAQVFSCAHAGDCGATTGGQSTNFSFTPLVTRNGPYSVSALVSGRECNVLNNCTFHNATANTSFSVGVHPVAPRNVKAQVNGDRSVTVSWSANPEPDVFGYQILRRDPGSSNSRAVNPFLAGTSWTDQGTMAAGGDYGYTVVAFRPGADGTSTATTVLSTSSATSAASVPAPPVPSTTIPPVGQPVNATTTTTMAPPPGNSGPDLSAFLAQASKQGAIPVAPPKVVVPPAASAPAHVGAPSIAAPAGPPDTYAPTLPYSAPVLGGGAPSSGGGGDTPQVALSGPVAKSHQHRSLLFSVAGGMLLCVLGFAVRTANQRPGPPAPLEPLTGGEGGGGGGASAAVPASVAAKAAARAAASARPSGPAAGPVAVAAAAAVPTGAVRVLAPPPAPAAAPGAAAMAPARGAGAGAGAAARGAGAGAAAAAMAPAAVGPADVPVIRQVPAVSDAAVGAGPAPAPAEQASAPPVARRSGPRTRRGKSAPSVDEAVDYFRLVRMADPDGAA
ncbi:MAG: hypothetical protein QOG44_832, partial [Acidimicrobiaceae bacterium]|nr:hypothetical protein [Acidimicrobiaceae bacterium]